MTDETKLKTHDLILLVLVAMLFVFGIESYYVTPKDPENAKVIVAAFIAAIGMVLSFKFGIHQAQVQPGTVQVTKTVNPPEPDKPADAQPIADPEDTK